MYAVSKNEITIREMKEEDIMPLIRISQLSNEMASYVSRELKQQIQEKTEESDMLFVILYKGKVVGKIDIIYTDAYIKDPKYKGIKVDGNMMIEIPPYDVCQKIADDVSDMFIEYCKKEGFVDVLGLPKVSPLGNIYWEPIEIIPSKTA